MFTTSLSSMWYTGISSQQTIPVARGRDTLRIRAGIRNMGHPETPQGQRNFVAVWHVSILARSEHGREPFTRMVGKVHWAWTPSGMPVHAREGSLTHVSTTCFVSGVYNYFIHIEHALRTPIYSSSSAQIILEGVAAQQVRTAGA